MGRSKTDVRRHGARRHIEARSRNRDDIRSKNDGSVGVVTNEVIRTDANSSHGRVENHRHVTADSGGEC